jgi:hypothetical protein
MKKLSLFLMIALVGCASLERDVGTPVDNPPDAGEPPPPPPPDAQDPPPPDGPPMPPDSCEPPVPECSCSADCGEDNVCVEGRCHQTCDCDYDCGNHQECHSHVCYNPHGD